jgi:hypothetical protein
MLHQAKNGVPRYKMDSLSKKTLQIFYTFRAETGETRPCHSCVGEDRMMSVTVAMDLSEATNIPSIKRIHVLCPKEKMKNKK